jgi:hypothetical protein
MARRGTLIAYVRRDDTVADFHTLLVPGSWELLRESDKWATVWPLTRTGSSVIGGQLRQHRDVFFHVCLMVAHDTLPRALFVCVGHPFILQQLADMIAADGLAWTRTWSTLAAFRADNTALAVQVRAAWPADHLDGGVHRIMARMAGFEDDDGEG